MTTFTPLSDATLSQDKPFTQDIARALRDNPLAQGEGDPTAPAILAKAIQTPYMHVQRTTNQVVIGTGNGTKVQFNNEIIDPLNLYDNVTNHRFTPNMAGLYKVQFSVSMERNSPTPSATTLFAAFFKNGSGFAGATLANPTATGSAALIGYTGSFETYIPMNGTTDYIEVYCGDTSGNGTIKFANFSAHMVGRA